MSKYAVLGLGKFGFTVATNLFDSGAEVVAVDLNEALVNKIQKFVSIAVKADATVEGNLSQLNLHEMDSVIVATCSDIEINITINMLLKKLKVTSIYNKIKDNVHKEILERMGIGNTIFPEEKVGIELARTLLHKNILGYTEISKTHSMIEAYIPEKFLGKSLSEVGLPLNYGINIIGIKKRKKRVNEEGENEIYFEINDSPSAGDILSSGDSFLLIGMRGRINDFLEIFQRGNKDEI